MANKQFQDGLDIPSPELVNPRNIIPPSDPKFDPKANLIPDPTKPGAIKLPLPGAGQPSGSDVLDLLNNFLETSEQESTNPSIRTKSRNFGAGMEHHQFERFYNLPRVYAKLGFSPFRDNETLYNKESNFLDEFGRASTQWANLSGLGAKDALTFGSLTDTDTARKFEKAMAIGSSSKEGAGAFINNLYLNSGYTFGIIGEAILEEAGLALITGLSGGGAAEATVPAMVARGLSAGNKVMDGYNAGKNVIRALDALKDAGKARSYFKQALMNGGKFINPLENTVNFIQGIDKIENLSKLSTTVNGFANFYKDVRNVRLAWGEAGLEGGMVRNTVEKELLKEFLEKNDGRAPTEAEANAIRETAIAAGTTTGWQNVGAIYFSNKIVFDNFRPLKKAFGKFTEDVVEAGVHGKIMRNKGLKENPFEYVEKNWRSSLKSLKNPSTYLKGGLTFFKANLAEGLQETAQEVIGGAAQDFYMNEWRGTPLKGGYYAAITDNLKKQVSPEGFEVFMSGFLMGGMVAPVMNTVAAVPKTYAKYRNPEAYQKAKQEKEDYINKTVNQLNELWNNTGEALVPDLDNLATQDQYSKGMTEAVEEGDAKTYHDLKDASYYEHIHTALKMGRLDTFIERLEDQKNLTPEEVKEGFGMSQQEYFSALDKGIARAKSIQRRYDYTQDKLKNPFDPRQYSFGTPEWMAEMDNSIGWSNAQKKLVFLQDSFDRHLERMSSIMGEAQTDAQLSKVPQNDFNTLFQNDTMEAELQLLNAEVDSLQGAKGEAGKLLQNKKRKQKLLKDFNEKMKAVKEHSEFGDPRASKAGKKAVSVAQTSYKNYLKYLAEVNKDYAFNDALDNSFDKLVDYYQLDKDVNGLNKSINILLDPGAFVKQAKRDAKLANMRRENQQKEFRESLEEFLKAKDTNDLLQLLYDEGMFFDTYELEALIKNGTMPSTFYYTPRTAGSDIMEVTKPEDIQKAKDIVEKFVTNVMDITIEEPEEVIADVSNDEYQTFINEGIVTEERIRNIANKIKAGAELSERETAIFNDKTDLVNAELIRLREGEEAPVAEGGIKVTKKDSLTGHPQLAEQALRLYKDTNAGRIADDNDPLDPDLASKTDDQILQSIQFKNFYKVSSKVQELIDAYNESTGRNQEPAAEPVKAGEVTIMSTAMRNRLEELGYKPGDYNVAQAQAIIDRGLTKEQADEVDVVAGQLRSEVLEQAKGVIRDEIDKLIAAANTIDELDLAEEEIARMLDDTIEGTGRTGWDSSGYQASDLDALIKARKDELAFSFEFEDIYPGMTIIMKNGEKLVIDEIKGKTIHAHKANDITKLRRITKAKVKEKVKYIFKKDMMDEDIVMPEETIAPEDTAKSNESQETVNASERESVNKDWLESDTEDEDLDPNC